MVTKEVITKISERFDALDNDDAELQSYFMIEYSDIYESETNDALKSLGFPVAETYHDNQNVAAHTNVDHELSFIRKPGEWEKWFIEENDYTEEEILSNEVPEDAYYRCMMNHINHFEIDVIIKEDLDEWLDNNPTFHHFVEVLSSAIDFHTLDDILEKEMKGNKEVYDELIRKIETYENNNEMMIDGLDDKNVWELMDIKINHNHVDYEMMGALLLENVERNGNVSNYIDTELYNDLLDKKDEIFKYHIDLNIEKMLEIHQEAEAERPMRR